jgi:tetratricopeptide (TPR) repeat protein
VPAALILLGSALWPVAAADVIHLKNGGTILADSYEERGENYVVRQGKGTIVVPRADVERIEKGPDGPPAPAAGGSRDRPAAAPEQSPADPRRGSEGPSREEIERRIEQLDRLIRDRPLSRAENTRQIVALLNLLAARAYNARDYDEALARFRQALGYDPHEARSQHGLAAAYFSQGQDVYARSTLEQAILDHPEDPELQVLLGDVYASQERPEDALAAWRKAYALKPTDAVKARLEKLGREHAIDGDYRLSEAAHFTLKYDGERAGPDLGGEIVSYLETQFTTLVTRFDYFPRQPIVVILYPRRQFYEATLAESNVAGLYDGKIRVPIGGLQQLNPEARNTLLHELAHAFIAGKSHGTAPRWLHEGLAQQIEGKTTPTGVGVSLAKEYQALEGKGGWGAQFSYPSALSFVEFLVEREGFHRLVDALEAMGSGAGPDDAFDRATRYSLDELRDDWGKALVGKYLQ